MTGGSAAGVVGCLLMTINANSRFVRGFGRRIDR
jgi:hypothetical protein